MKIATPWIKLTDKFYIRANIKEPFDDNRQNEIAFIQKAYDSFSRSTESGGYEWVVVGSNEVFGERRLLKQAMEDCDEALIKNGWILLSEKFGFML